MALTQCKECGGKVSDQAASCPHCGFIINSPPDTPKRVITTENNPLTRNRGCLETILLGSLIMFIIAAVLGGMGF